MQTVGDLTPPMLASAEASFSRTNITVRFTEPVRVASLRSSDFSLDGGVDILRLSFGDDHHEVVLDTTFHPDDTPLTLTVNGARDTSPNANPIAPDSTIAVAEATIPALPTEVATNVGVASDGYELVYSLNIPTTGNFNAGNPYAVDLSDAPGPFSRIAYYVETERSGQAPEFVWVAMDAFATSKGAIGIPTAASGAVFQQPVANMEVISNVAGVETGSGLTGGNLEFWPTNYTQPNGAGVPGASDATYDFGDTRTASGTHGSMQVHNAAEAQTIFAMNNWGADGNPIALGLGNQPSGNPDWTFANNAGTYTRRVLHVMVLPEAAPPVPAEVLANVPEAGGYELVYTLDIPAAGNLSGGSGFTPYTVDLSNGVTPFDRVAYYLELQRTGEPGPTYLWVSMDAFTGDRGDIGVPNLASGAVFQQEVTNMNVVSNSPNVTAGTGLTGNLEFWPTNYDRVNSAGVPGASGSTFDFGDRPTAGNYGSMQVHHAAAAQTLFALNRWGATGETTIPLCLGIGNRPGVADTDWTFADNAAEYDVLRRLHVLVQPGNPALDGPEIVKALGSTSLDKLVVTFDRALADSAASAGNFTLDGGVTVTDARLLPGGRAVALSTTLQTAGTLYTVAVTGVRENSATAGEIAPGASVQFTAATPPAVLANVPEAADYDLIYHLAIPVTKPQWNLNPITYSIDEAQYGERLFDRVAYLMELDGNWVYASFDAFGNQIGQIGVPALTVSSTPVQRIVTDMNVASNVGTIVTGEGISTGNIEFWGGNYAAANGIGIPGASDSLFDFGDTMSVGGHGSMQVHNHGAGQTLFGYNNWGSNAGGESELGIGNDPAPVNGGVDWTFHANTSTYTTRNLYVLARAGGVPSGAPPVILTQPCDRQVDPGADVTLAVTVAGDGPVTYQWRFNGMELPGETRPWLELFAVDGTDAGSYDVVVTGANLVATTSSIASLTVIGTNQPPTFGGFAFAVPMDGSAIIPISAILAKANDLNGDPLTLDAVGNPSTENGSVTADATSVIYQPAAGFTGTDTFTVTISDDQTGVVMGTVTATVTHQEITPGIEGAIALLAGGQVETVFAGMPGQEYGFQRSTGLGGWVTIQTAFAGDDGVLVFTDPSPPAGGRVFYRTIAPAP